MVPASSVRAQLGRFLAVGVLNTAFGYGCFAALLWLGIHYGPALLASTVLGVLFNFKTTGRLVFRSSDNLRIVGFVGAYALVYGVNVAGVALMNQAGISPALGGAVMLLPAATLAFFLQRKFVFNGCTTPWPR